MNDNDITPQSNFAVMGKDGFEVILQLVQVVTLRATKNGMFITIGIDTIYSKNCTLDDFMLKVKGINLFCRANSGLIINVDEMQSHNKTSRALKMKNGFKGNFSKQGLVRYNSMKKLIDFTKPVYKQGKLLFPVPEKVKKILKKVLPQKGKKK